MITQETSFNYYFSYFLDYFQRHPRAVPTHLWQSSLMNQVVYQAQLAAYAKVLRDQQNAPPQSRSLLSRVVDGTVIRR